MYMLLISILPEISIQPEKLNISWEAGLEMKSLSFHLFGAGFVTSPSLLKDIVASKVFLLGSFFSVYHLEYIAFWPVSLLRPTDSLWAFSC